MPVTPGVSEATTDTKTREVDDPLRTYSRLVDLTGALSEFVARKA
jgi:hypothetical protein